MERRIFQMVFVVLSIVGLILIFNAFNWGSSAAISYLDSIGGGGDIQIKLAYQEKILAYRWTGSIMLFLGILGEILISVIRPEKQ